MMNWAHASLSMLLTADSISRSDTDGRSKTLKELPTLPRQNEQDTKDDQQAQVATPVLYQSYSQDRGAAIMAESERIHGCINSRIRVTNPIAVPFAHKAGQKVNIEP